MNPWILIVYLFAMEYGIRSSKSSSYNINPAAYRYKPQDKASKVIAVPGSRRHREFES